MSLDTVFSVCKEFFAARGYTITRTVPAANTSRIHASITGSDRDGKSVVLYIMAPECKLNIDTFKWYYKLFLDHRVSRGIIVHSTACTASVREFYPTCQVDVELFRVEELRFNVLKHTYVPLHVRVDHWDNNNRKYPLLKKSDPVARFMGYIEGDVIRIQRADGSLYYRYVTP